MRREIRADENPRLDASVVGFSAGGLSEVVFEGVEKLKEFVADPLTIAATTDAGRYESTPVSPSRFNAARAPVGVTSYRAAAVVCGHDRLRRKPEDDLAGDGVGARCARPLV
jgi:hypothetical protein